ncbi:MAG TPA: ABC transporter ATP-binding protein [Amycolatopsis sp.]|jgi:energy-coupling factor transport system ATP-binding protein|nr:ABC transporter ATP-binding protein [Amycolatopsis sp.]
MSEPLIQVRDVEFRYPGHSPVLHGVDLTIDRGEFVALLGQNGAGKTTLAKHFNGLLTPTKGQVLVGGKPTSALSLTELARQVGYCYQNPDHQIFAPTVDKEVRFGPDNLGLPDAAELADRALALVGLTAQREANPFVLGRGQRQLLAVASIIAMDPPVLVVDEPTTGMDLAGAERIMRLLASWVADGRTIIVITHDMDVVAEFIPRSVVMAHGEVLADGPTEHVLRRSDLLPEARLLAPPAITVSDELSRFGVGRCGTIRDVADDLVHILGGRDAGRV